MPQPWLNPGSGSSPLGPRRPCWRPDVIGDRLAPPDGHMAAPAGPQGTQALASCMATHPASAIQQAGSMHRNAEKVQFLLLSCALVYKSIVNLLMIFHSFNALGVSHFFFADHSPDMFTDHGLANLAKITSYNSLARSSVISLIKKEQFHLQQGVIEQEGKATNLKQDGGKKSYCSFLN